MWVSGRRFPEGDVLTERNQGSSDLRPRLSKISFPRHPRDFWPSWFPTQSNTSWTLLTSFIALFHCLRGKPEKNQAKTICLRGNQKKKLKNKTCKLFSVVLKGNHLSHSVITYTLSRKNNSHFFTSLWQRHKTIFTLRIMLCAFPFHL